MALPPRRSLREVLPELKAWNDGQGISPESWLSIFGSVPQAVAYSALFWPTFAEHRGCLLWADFTPENFESWMESTNGDQTAVELVMNHRHISDFFLNTEEQPTPEQIAYLGFLLRDIWSLKLHTDFPHLKVRVEFVWNDPDHDEDAQLLVYLQRDG